MLSSEIKVPKSQKSPPPPLEIQLLHFGAEFRNQGTNKSPPHTPPPPPRNLTSQLLMLSPEIKVAKIEIYCLCVETEPAWRTMLLSTKNVSFFYCVDKLPKIVWYSLRRATLLFKNSTFTPIWILKFHVVNWTNIKWNIISFFCCNVVR